MKWYCPLLNKVVFFIIQLFLVFTLTSCGGGDDGAQGPAGPTGPAGPEGPTGPPGTAAGTDEADELTIAITSVTTNGAPVINFSATNKKGEGFNALSDGDLRFNISKLIPSTNGNPSQWQNYVVRASSGAMQGSQERSRTGYPWGELVNNNDGTYQYTFGTDISSVDCPDPCTDLQGNTLDLSFQNSLTHRITIQQGNRDYPLVNAVHDFVPDGSDVTMMKEITKTESCNECHDKITVHGTRFEMKLCVTCHNPGTWNAGDNLTVDLGHMVHKIHHGENLPSVEAGGTYVVRGHDFSNVVFPQDIRNCTKCHDGEDPDTPQGSAWLTPNMSACGSCHDDVDFSKDGSGDPPIDPTGHSGGIVADNSECSTCHAEGRIAGSVAESHMIPGKADRDLFQFNILAVCGTAIADGPVCAPGTNPSLMFSVTDPSGATTHEYGNAYNVKSTGTDPEFTAGGASFNALFAWSTLDYTNHDGSGSRPSRTDSVNLRTSAAVTDNGDGTFTLDGAAAGITIPANATGSGAVALEGHPYAASGTTSVAVNSEVDYFAITDSSPMPRRQIVDVPTKCDRCHDVLAVHGSNRNNNGQLCVMCHNPAGTDVGRRPKDANGLPDATVTVDGKKEETIDFKHLIHGIHAAAKSNYDGSDAHGFREKGIVAYGYGGSAHDYSHVRFPGVLSKCETCHLPDTYTLADRSDDGGANWAMPSFSGIIGSTIDSAPYAASDGSDFSVLLADHSDDWKMSPTVSACSGCHDSDLAKQHMMDNNGILGGPGSEQAVQESNLESCSVCHGPGRIADVKLVHDEAFAAFLGEIIP